jgi:hypothetical protein
MSDERDDFSGRYTETYSLDSFINAVEDSGMASTQEIADKVGCSYDLAYRRLKELDSRDKIDGKKVGNTYHWSPQAE